MFGLFKKKKTDIELLEAQYEKLQREAYQLSTSNRKLSDQKYAEAQEVLKKIDLLIASNR